MSSWVGGQPFPSVVCLFCRPRGRRAPDDGEELPEPYLPRYLRYLGMLFTAMLNEALVRKQYSRKPDSEYYLPTANLEPPTTAKICRPLRRL